MIFNEHKLTQAAKPGLKSMKTKHIKLNIHFAYKTWRHKMLHRETLSNTKLTQLNSRQNITHIYNV